MNILSNLIAKIANHGTPTATPKIISDKKAEEVKSILIGVGLDEEDHYGFINQMKNKSSYQGGAFEWTIREQGVRYWVEANPITGTITTVSVTQNGFTSIPEAAINHANMMLIRVFLKG